MHRQRSTDDSIYFPHNRSIEATGTSEKSSEKDGNVAPQRKLANEKPPGVTVDYDELIKSWKVPQKG